MGEVTKKGLLRGLAKVDKNKGLEFFHRRDDDRGSGVVPVDRLRVGRVLKHLPQVLEPDRHGGRGEGNGEGEGEGELR